MNVCVRVCVCVSYVCVWATRAAEGYDNERGRGREKQRTSEEGKSRALFLSAAKRGQKGGNQKGEEAIEEWRFCVCVCV